ncbi:hypothetical protein [Sphingomonas aerophila]|uniref:Uncharacterized protein n=1 Tax=Sphingomonas aerophila TaxID=1344948 RepID=A0A7W9BDZ3_9SPHN|nr:hypothetical protein [Sphingomonas aerophila]MBB5715470.1 hypothetical protein [Sphingomonas aerophila]
MDELSYALKNPYVARALGDFKPRLAARLSGRASRPMLGGDSAAPF